MENREIKLYLLRHGETVWNKQKKIQGQLNSPLTEEGIEKLNENIIRVKNGISPFYKKLKIDSPESIFLCEGFFGYTLFKYSSKSYYEKDY